MSERSRRRLGKQGVLNGTMTEGIKYYIDLRPAEEDVEAIELVTSLTCTRGILNWYKAKAKYSIDPTIICGRDDFVSPLDQFREAELMKEDEPDETDPPVMTEAEYSALRHRSAIERVVQAIGHNDPKLDSAPKMWTYFQVAKHLDVAKHERVSGWITKWLCQHPNSNFVQSNPEVVYCIGMGIMSTAMIYDAYSMLAGEKALLDTSDLNRQPSSKKSVHGRPLENLDDDESNRVDHAAASLNARVKLRFEHLVDENMDWLKTGDEYRKMMSLKPRNDTEKTAITEADMMIKDYVRGRILWVLGRNYLSDYTEFDQAMASCRDFREDLPRYFNEVYGKLNEEQRLLTRTLWIALQTEKIEEGSCNAHTPERGSTGVLYLQSVNAHNYNYRPIGDEMIAREDRAPGTGVKITSCQDLSAKIGKVNRICLYHFLEDKELNRAAVVEESNDYILSSPSRKQPAGKLGPQLESSTPQSKHDLIDLDSEDEAPLEMTDHAGSQPGLGKRRRFSYEELADGSGEHRPQTSTLPLRSRVPDLVGDEKSVMRGENVTDDSSDRALPALVRDYASASFSPNTPASTYKSVSFSEAAEISDSSQELGRDNYARSVAEQESAETWKSFEGDVYMQAHPLHHFKQLTEDASRDIVWVAMATPFLERKTTLNSDKFWRDEEKEYWRATTGQLFCKLRDGSINFVLEDSGMVPTLAETSSRILDDQLLYHYVLAYDAYARNLAEQLSLPYWTALSGDMYLRSPPKHQHADSNIWNPACALFNDLESIDIRSEGASKVEYWRSPAGHLFRRRAGRIELYTAGKEEVPPLDAASIFPAPLKMATSSGMHKVPPLDRFTNKPLFAANRNVQPSPGRERSSLSPRDFHPSEPSYPTFFVKTMLLQFSDILWKICEELLHPPHIYHGTDPISRNLMDTLMCLTDDEWKYLPLWAGGCDDGTGGVFTEVDVPNLEAGGFAGGKRGLGSVAVDGKGESDWSDVASEAISTVGRASRLATDGTETVKSFDSASTQEFMKQDEVYQMLQDINVRREESKKEAEDEDQVTVMGGASDIQGELFGDIDDDKEVGGFDKDEDDDFELVDADQGAFIPVAKD